MSALLITSLAAGMVATVNPCGFAMLPAYVSYFLGANASSSGMAAVRRALTVSGLMAVGFLMVFGTAGLLLTFGVQAIIEFIPWLAVIVGAGLVSIGIRTSRGNQPTIPLGSGRADRSSVLRFGISYAIASLSCTLPIFLSLVAGTFARSTVGEGVASFIAYSLGMSMVITAITVTLAFGQDRVSRVVRSSAPHFARISGLVLVGAGLFITWYWLTVLSSGAERIGSSGVVRWLDRLSSSITGFIGDRPLVVAAGITLVVATMGAALRSGRLEDVGAEHRPGDVDPS